MTLFLNYDRVSRFSGTWNGGIVEWWNVGGAGVT